VRHLHNKYYSFDGVSKLKSRNKIKK